MKNNPNKLWIAVIALGWVFDFLFWKQSPGVNFAIFMTLCVAVAFYLLLSEGLRPHRVTLVLIPLFGFFGAVSKKVINSVSLLSSKVNVSTQNMRDMRNGTLHCVG